MAERYNTPEQGTLDWHVPLNENFNLLDTDVEVRDTETNLTNYAPDAGAKFLATDTGRRYIGDGSSWTEAPLTVPTVSSDPSSPVDGQMWFNTTDGALRVSTPDGTVDIASTSGSDSGSTATYYDGDTIRSSNHSSLQAAVDAASARDTVLIDTDHVLSDWVTLKSDILVRGDGGTIRAADGTGSDMLRPANVSNVWIDGVTIDGGWGGPNNDTNVGTRLIGGINPGNVEHLRITNCTLRNSGLNAIEFGEKSGNTVQDVYIANNTIENPRNHGCVLWAEDNGGQVKNVLIENNTVKNTYLAQAIGVFGRGGSEYTTQCAIVDNLVDNTGYSDDTGTNLALEEKVSNSIIYANEVLGNTDSRVGGAGVSKDGRHCIIGNNRLENHGRSLKVRNFGYYEPDGPPKYNVVMENYVPSGSSGFFYEYMDGDLHVSDNRIDISPVIDDGGNNEPRDGSNNYTFYNNGSSVSTSTAGLPDSVGTSVTYTDADGNTVGSASWDRGSVDPSDPVSVSVSTNV